MNTISQELDDAHASRRYFDKFENIIAHMKRVAGVMEVKGDLSRDETRVLARYATRLTFTFRALSLKYLMAGQGAGHHFGALDIDTVHSGFPQSTEILRLANDAQQAAQHLMSTPSEAALKREMLDVILSELKVPTKLQFALSQRLYYEELSKGDLFWAQNDPELKWLGNIDEDRRRFLLHWAVYDTDLNLPVVYVMELEDSGRTTLPKDQRRWPEVQAHLMAQALGTLKLLTIAKGLDEDFDNLHPKQLRRFHLGPMYSSAFTKQYGPLMEVLKQAVAPQGQDWALVWTMETLRSERVTQERAGWFSTVEREIFALDPFSGRGADTGASETERAVILPQRPYQALEETNPPGFAHVRKFVVGTSGRVLSF